ncbi:bifunctional alpha/beta hydrolase/OsmC family protein [Cyclobacterium sp. SYSU L10401]|uniref:bifunctional alpha/beta hydrolase/OsmC family protein n=1 Tax=Cyclobacterium sp. SYSU L10401 TaxID=2678657 RepID=UPI0013D05629|nr:bifunctional alpha/beta hydrolase/OsmC family protein [Cyclobacterium sp. SYSU L10401]
MKTEKVLFKNRKDLNLAAFIYHPLDQPPRFYALFGHCFTCSKNLKAVQNICNTLSQMGVAVMSFDFTGLGNSDGEFENTDLSSNISDLVDAANFLAEEYEAPSLLIGHSFGGAASIYAAQSLPGIKALATIGSPSDLLHISHLFEEHLDTIKDKGNARVNIGGRDFGINHSFLQDLQEKDLGSFLSKLRKPILILHSPQDNIVAISHAAKLYEKAFHPKSFVSLDGADHLLSESKDSQYAGEIISTWAKKYIPSRSPPNDTKGHEVKVRLAGKGYTSEVKTPFHHLLADEPKEVGGDNLGPTPYDLLMAALGSCTAMTLQMYAQRKKWDLEEIVVYLDHDKVHRKDGEAFEKKDAKISRFTRYLKISGALNEEKRAKLLEIANKCPVHRTLEEDIIIETKFKDQPL